MVLGPLRAGRRGVRASAYHPGGTAGLRPDLFRSVRRAAGTVEGCLRSRGPDGGSVPSALQAGRAVEGRLPTIAGAHPAAGDPSDGVVGPTIPARLRLPSVGLPQPVRARNSQSRPAHPRLKAHNDDRPKPLTT